MSKAPSFDRRRTSFRLVDGVLARLDSLDAGVYFRSEVIYHHRTADATGNSRSLLLLTPIGTSTKTNRSHSTRNSYSQHSVFIYTPPITCTSSRSQSARRISFQDGSCEFRTGSRDPGGTALTEFRTACFFLIVLYRCVLSVITILPQNHTSLRNPHEHSSCTP